LFLPHFSLNLGVSLLTRCARQARQAIGLKDSVPAHFCSAKSPPFSRAIVNFRSEIENEILEGKARWIQKWKYKTQA
jgi:hypothetical protein